MSSNIEKNMLSNMAGLESIPLFWGIEEKSILSMLKCLGAYTKRHKKGEFIIISEEKIRFIGIIMSGSIEMIREDLWGNKTILSIMKRKEVFGETFVCGKNSCSTVSFRTMEECEVLYLPFLKVIHVCSMQCFNHHKLIENMMQLIAEKNMRLIEKIEVMSCKTLREKICAFLDIYCGENKDEWFNVPMGRIDMAEYLCAHRSSVARELKLMKQEGIIDFKKNKFKIIK